MLTDFYKRVEILKNGDSLYLYYKDMFDMNQPLDEFTLVEEPKSTVGNTQDFDDLSMLFLELSPI